MVGNTERSHGEFVLDGATEWFKIDEYDHLDPFLITVVTPDDLWMYVSSSGALAAGRTNPEQSLFPYETDDRLHRAGGLTGPVTIIRTGGQTWEPFVRNPPAPGVRRSIAKSVVGDQLRFSEYNPTMGLSFSYTWTTADRLGLVRSCELTLDDDREPVSVEVLDGLVNILPSGVELGAQQTTSTLIDAYRRSEFDVDSGLALFSLEALVSDEADPAEALSATTVWLKGLNEPTVALSERQLRAFRSGESLQPEHLAIGCKGAFLASSSHVLEAGRTAQWSFTCDVGRDHIDVAALVRQLTDGTIQRSLTSAIDASNTALMEIVTKADGLQITQDRRATVHHFANVLFNCMRGGCFPEDHRVQLPDATGFIANRNNNAVERFKHITAGVEAEVEIGSLRDAVKDDDDLYRLVNEYLPITFSRRHGDPSRPWNRFNISTRNEDGSWLLGYEGNWRDIFQNWEALLHSFPGYFESVIAKFLNASTLDGHNPYRITDKGVDWELPESGSWGNFGYWGDHQIIYLHRLLRAAEQFQPELLPDQLARSTFSFSDVPYRIRPYGDLVHDAKQTIDFDSAAQIAIEKRVRATGGDGRLVPTTDGRGVHMASMAEKLLIPALAKLSSLVAGAGIWMNTQRPEWNDANNALVGSGVSTVTLFHLNQYLSSLETLLGQSTVAEVPIGGPVIGWLDALQEQFDAHSDLSNPDTITPDRRRSLLDGLGEAFSRYRAEVYQNGPGQARSFPVTDLIGFIAAVRPHLEAATKASTRPDGLFHSYWLVDLSTAGTADITPLYEMLEGQVAALGLPDFEPDRSVALVDALFRSDLYRADQRSFMLYPNRPRPRFMDRNQIPVDAASPVVTDAADSASDLIRRDVDGIMRFASRLQSARQLEIEVEHLEEDERAEILDAYEATFGHHAFTGRSQTMYKYEGLGSIYWHMVSKLLFAIQEKAVDTSNGDHSSETTAALVERYRRVRAGLGFTKSVTEQGAFPTDPYSHTPSHLGAQQPGMTGQVKEGVLIRLGELGLRVSDGCVGFQPVLLDPNEFLEEPAVWDVLGETLEAKSLGFTYCGVPIIYRLVDGPSAWTARWADGSATEGEGWLDRETSSALFSRTGTIVRIDVTVSAASLTPVA